MRLSSSSSLSSWVLLAGLLSSAWAAERNVTIDDFQRQLITYTPASEWRATSDGATTDRYLQTTTFTRTQGSFASFTFTGTAIYYVGYGEITNNFPSMIRIEVDGQASDVPSSLGATVRNAQQILFAQRGLTNGEHTIVVRKTSQSGGRDVNIDAFVYTVDDGTPTIAGGGNSPTGTNPPNNTNTSTQGSGGVSIGGIVGGILGGIVFGALLVLGALFFMRRRKKAALAQSQGFGTGPYAGPGGGSLRPGGGAGSAYSPNGRPMTMLSHAGSALSGGPNYAGHGAGAASGGVLYGGSSAALMHHQSPPQHTRNLSSSQLYPVAPSSSSVRSGPYSYQPEPFRPVPQPADAAPWASPSTPPPPTGSSNSTRKYLPPAFPGTTPITQ